MIRRCQLFWKTMHLVELPGDVFSHSRHGSTSSLLLLNEKWEPWSVVTIAQEILMIAWHGLSRPDRCINFSNRNRTFSGEAKVEENRGNPKKLWRTLSTILGKDKNNSTTSKELTGSSSPLTVNPSAGWSRAHLTTTALWIRYRLGWSRNTLAN